MVRWVERRGKGLGGGGEVVRWSVGQEGSLGGGGLRA